MQNQDLLSQKFRLLTNSQSETWYLTGELKSTHSGKLVILDNNGSLVSRQIVKLVKGENKIPVSKNTFTNAKIHVIILYVGEDVIFSELILDRKLQSR
jgi:hypothetical protein